MRGDAPLPVTVKPISLERLSEIVGLRASWRVREIPMTVSSSEIDPWAVAVEDLLGELGRRMAEERT